MSNPFDVPGAQPSQSASGAPTPPPAAPVPPAPVPPALAQPAPAPPGPVPPAPAPPGPYALYAPPAAVATAQKVPKQRSARTPRSALVATAVITALVTSGATAGLTWAVLDHDRAPATVQQASTAGTDSSTDEGSGTKVRQVSNDSPDWTSVADAVRPSVVAVAVMGSSGSGEGSGVIIDAAGHVLTNNHVVSGAQQIKVTLFDGRVYDATVVGTDPTTDLAVIAITDAPSDLSPATLGDSSTVEVGDAVMAVGNPLGLDSTVTTGIVSALDRPVSTGSTTSTELVVTNAIQVDAAINPGNSGGPLFDANGQVIGVTSSIATLSQMSSQSGSIGLGFAIPVNLAKLVADQLITDGSVQHAYLGVYPGDGTATVDGTTRLGASVDKISDGSPAASADLKVGDVVVAIDGKPVSGALSLTAYVREHAVGDSVKLTVVRDGKSRDIEVTLTQRQESTQQEQQGPTQTVPGR